MNQSYLNSPHTTNRLYSFYGIGIVIFRYYTVLQSHHTDAGEYNDDDDPYSALLSHFIDEIYETKSLICNIYILIQK